jgi:hypothetical protein
MLARMRPAAARPATLREAVLVAGAACALGSLALVGAQLALPEEPRGFAGSLAHFAASGVAVALGSTTPGAAPVDRRVETLRARLLIEPGATLPEWDRLAAVLRGNAQLVDDVIARRPRGLAASAGTASEVAASAVATVRAQAEMAGARARALDDLLAALQPLYEVMTPQQRRAADRVFRAGLRPGGTPG